MDAWQIAFVANTVIGIGYLLIVMAIVVPLVKGRQLRANPLGAATAAIFLTCAIHHGAHAVHMILPAFGLDEGQGLAMREAWGWSLAIWDVVGAVVAVYYWTLRRNYGSLMQSAQLFEDFRKRERQALELNDNVLQSLVVAKMALDLDQKDKARQALDTSIGSASHMISEWLGSGQRTPSDGLLRQSAATVEPTAAWATTKGTGAASPEPPEESRKGTV